MDEAAYRVNFADMDDYMDAAHRFQQHCVNTYEQLQTQSAAMVDAWTGKAAAAQHEANKEVAAGVARITHAVRTLGLVVAIAHQNYHGALAADDAMWEQ